MTSPSRTATSSPSSGNASPILRLHEIKLPLDHADDALAAAVVESLEIEVDDVLGVSVFKRSYDAHHKSRILLIYQLDVELPERLEQQLLEKFSRSSYVGPSPDTSYPLVAQAGADFPAPGQQRPIVIGFGPYGIIAELLLAQISIKPMVLERGQAVRQRTQDTWGLWRKRKLNTESNVQYGEGGAGIFSDGKLYSEVKDKRYLGRKVLNEFVAAGAPQEILYESKSHIGTFKLVLHPQLHNALDMPVFIRKSRARFGSQKD